MPDIHEPPVNDDDTQPSIATRPDDFDERIRQQQAASSKRHWLGWTSLLGAALFTIGTLVVLIVPQGSTPAPAPTEDALVVAPTTVPATTPPTQAPATAVVAEANPAQTADSDIPAIDPAALQALLQSPVDVPENSVAQRVAYNPFTVITNDRPRTEFVEYEVVQGDTMDAISRRYNLERESIAWCNQDNRRIIQVLRPGDVLRIPPVDGACHRVLGTRQETVNSIAQQYELDDPFAIIDSPYNPQLFGRSPDDILPGGVRVFIPGGKGPVITWNPGYEAERDSAGNVVGVTFAPGQAGSCGRVNPGSGAAWGHPLPNGTWIRGFYAGHSGVDLAAPVGTPIYAANSGNVIFSGFSQWGYGEAIVLAHGPFSTLYGHMSQRNIVCGQFASVGQVIGLVGNTGNSSGPHLHFEIRFSDEPTDPTATIGF